MDISTGGLPWNCTFSASDASSLASFKSSSAWAAALPAISAAFSEAFSWRPAAPVESRGTTGGPWWYTPGNGGKHLKIDLRREIIWTIMTWGLLSCWFSGVITWMEEQEKVSKTWGVRDFQCKPLGFSSHHSIQPWKKISPRNFVYRIGPSQLHVSLAPFVHPGQEGRDPVCSGCKLPPTSCHLLGRWKRIPSSFP